MAKSNEIFHFKILIIGESSVGKVWQLFIDLKFVNFLDRFRV